MNRDAAMETGAEPIARQARIEDIDVIRGLALFGVLMMNLVTAFRVPFWNSSSPPGQGLDYVVHRLLVVLLANKAMTLFSILFGAGLAIFLERASAREAHPMRLLCRRLFFLLAFGLAHLFLVWDGDILISYALFGMVALLFIRRSTTVILVAIAACLAIPSLEVLSPWVVSVMNPPASAPNDEALRIYQGISYLDIFHYRAHEAVTHIWRGYVTYWPHELKNMLIGILVWRSGILRAPLERLRLLRWTALVGIVAGSTFPIYRIVVFELYHPPPGPPAPGRLLAHWFTVTIFALGYGAGILLLLRRTRLGKWVAAAAPLGRMAFTNYLTQSLVFSTLFYGYGFGLIGKLGTAKTAAIGIVFYILQGIFSTIWLRHFRFGPFEWAWRSLTYGKWQPFRRHHPTVILEA
ncbi:DUF418 domain-containing protein [Pendulispora brunnea]|uniref:DUF418 domain-containing protein n=1 Tax=Pendulispora brunnea TaxID=2905690 RepID=A0ABZ2KP23_9BACT